MAAIKGYLAVSLSISLLLALQLLMFLYLMRKMRSIHHDSVVRDLTTLEITKNAVMKMADAAGDELKSLRSKYSFLEGKTREAWVFSSAVKDLLEKSSKESSPFGRDPDIGEHAPTAPKRIDKVDKDIETLLEEVEKSWKKEIDDPGEDSRG